MDNLLLLFGTGSALGALLVVHGYKKQKFYSRVVGKCKNREVSLVGDLAKTIETKQGEIIGKTTSFNHGSKFSTFFVLVQGSLNLREGFFTSPLRVGENPGSEVIACVRA